MRLRECFGHQAGVMRDRAERLKELADYFEAEAKGDDLPDIEVGWAAAEAGWLALYSVRDVMGAARALSAYLGITFVKRVNQHDGEMVAHCYDAPAPLGQLHLEGSPGPSCTVERIVKGMKQVEDVEFKVTGCEGVL